jgi:hypothetical protein
MKMDPTHSRHSDLRLIMHVACILVTHSKRAQLCTGQTTAITAVWCAELPDTSYYRCTHHHRQPRHHITTLQQSQPGDNTKSARAMYNQHDLSSVGDIITGWKPVPLTLVYCFFPGLTSPTKNTRPAVAHNQLYNLDGEPSHMRWVSREIGEPSQRGASSSPTELGKPSGLHAVDLTAEAKHSLHFSNESNLRPLM